MKFLVIVLVVRLLLIGAVEMLDAKQKNSRRSINVFRPIKKKGGIMFWKVFSRKVKDLTGLFNGHFLEVKALYAVEFDAVASVCFIGELDVAKAFAFIKAHYQSDIVTVYQHSYFDHGEQECLFNNTIYVLSDKRMIELGNSYCQVLHQPTQHNWAYALIKQLSQFRIAQAEAQIGFARQTTMN